MYTTEQYGKFKNVAANFKRGSYCIAADSDDAVFV